MGAPNLAVNCVMMQKEIFADYINGTIYGGRKFLCPEMLEQISPYVGTSVKNEKGRKWRMWFMKWTMEGFHNFFHLSTRF